MSSGSWQNVAVEDNWSTFDFREAPFRRRAICHSSPASDIYADSMVPHVASIHTESYKNNICFVKKKKIQNKGFVGMASLHVGLFWM